LKNSRIILLIFLFLTYLIYSATILTVSYGTSQSMPSKNNNNNKTAVYGSGNDNNKVIRFKQMAKRFFVFSSQQKIFDASSQTFRQIDALIANNSNGMNTATILSFFRAGDKQEQEFSKQSKSLPSITDYNTISSITDGKQRTFVRLYDPTNGSSSFSPLLIFLHGGGGISGDAKGAYDLVGKYLANVSGFKVASINYRLAPEHPFPDALNDVVSTIRWIANNCKGLRIDCHRIALGGASAGARLALSSALVLRDLGQGDLVRTIYLLYGHYSPTTVSESYDLFGNGGFGETTLDIKFFMNQTFQKTQDYRNPLAFPIFANLTGLPPVYIVAAALDPLKDDSITLANLLEKSGQEYYLNIWPGVGHGVLNILSSVPEAKIYVDSMIFYLRGVLTKN
jgi:acetyl esterase